MKVKPSMTTVLLLRHGEIPQSNPRCFVGQRDLPLTAVGRDQALRWRGALTRTALGGVWTSDLARCREMTGHVLGDHHPAAKPLPALREISLGEWEGLSVAEVRRLFPGEYERRGADLERVAPAGGESFAALRDRVWPALNGTLAAAGESQAPLLVVTHAGVIRTLICQSLGMYYKSSIFDLVVPRLLAGDRLTRADIAALGHGGYCSACAECRFPLCPFGKGA